MKPNTLTRLLLAVVAAAALAVAASPGSRAAEPRTTASFQLVLDGYDVGLFDNATEVGGDGLLLRRGTASPALVAWAIGQKRQDPEVVMLSGSGSVLRRWRLENALPVKWELGEYDAGKNEVAVESLTLASERSSGT